MLMVRSALLAALLSSVTAICTESAVALDDLARDLNRFAVMQSSPDLLRIFRAAVEEHEFLVGKAQRLEVRRGHHGLVGLVSR